MKKSKTNPSGKHIISKSKGFQDGIYFARYNSDNKYFPLKDFNILSCTCQDYEQLRKQKDFLGPILLANYVVGIKAIENYANKNNLKTITETLDSDPMDYYIDREIVNPPRYLERKMVVLKNKPRIPKNILAIRSIQLNRADYDSGLYGMFKIGVPAEREDLFKFIINSIKTPVKLSSWEEFRKALLEIHTNKNIEAAEEILSGLGFQKDDGILFR